MYNVYNQLFLSPQYIEMNDFGLRHIYVYTSGQMRQWHYQSTCRYASYITYSQSLLVLVSPKPKQPELLPVLLIMVWLYIADYLGDYQVWCIMHSHGHVYIALFCVTVRFYSHVELFQWRYVKSAQKKASIFIKCMAMWSKIRLDLCNYNHHVSPLKNPI